MNAMIQSFQGRAREENADRAGAVFDGSRGLFVIADGTSKAGSGALAQEFVVRWIDTYQTRSVQSVVDDTHEAAAQLMLSVLIELHAVLFARFSGSTSYLAAVVANGLLTVAYEGDCCCGIVDAVENIEWITPPHCVANWQRNRSHHELAGDPGRNRITRSFKANRAPEPEIVVRSVLAGERLVFATDGFWGDMSEVCQAKALRSPEFIIRDVDDDVTWIDVRI